MGIFTRVRDIINSNVNAMLDKAEDPEKLIRLMIQEMEDTLVEIKASCAGAIAERKKIERQHDVAKERAASWGDRAGLAVDKGRDDLAREALLEKRRYQDRARSLEQELEASVDELARQLADKASHALLATKRHVNAVTEQMVGTMRSWSDADGLVVALSDDECVAARQRYLESKAGS